MATIKTTLHAYSFDIQTADGKAAYDDLRMKLKALGLRCFETHGGGSHYRPDLAGEIELETKYLFSNQWNTAPIPRAKNKDTAEKGARVFDWAQDYNSQTGAPRGVKRGHWLEQTAEMREARRNTVKCGFCGAQEPAAKGYVFCPHCTDSAYLKEADLFLTRMRPVDGQGPRAPLTQAEADHIAPIYRRAQIEGSTARGRARLAKTRANIEADYKRAAENADAKYRAAVWLMDNAPGLLENWIFYPHAGRSCFGWRRAYPQGEAARVARTLAGFPGDFDIETA